MDQARALQRNWNDIPFSPKKFPFAYHWVILFGGTVGVIMSAPGQTIGVSAFTDDLMGALDISRMRLSVAYMVGTTGSACLLPLAGVIYDRWGARWLAPLVAALLGGVLVALSQCDRIARIATELLGAQGSGAATFAVIALLFMALRFFGQGVITMASRNMVMKWFRRRRGLAASVIAVCLALAFSLTPKACDFLIRRYDWRTAWILIGSVIGAGFSVFALTLFRDNPEDCGLVPDGTSDQEEGEIAYEPSEDFTLRQALATRAFWLFNLAAAGFGLYITAFTFHVVSVFEHSGMARDVAMSIFLPVAVISVIGSLVAGYLADRVKLKYILAAMVGGMMLSSGGLSLMPSGRAVGTCLVVAGNGLASGLFGVLSSVTWPRFYGRTNLGKITSVNLAVAVFASAIGPPVFAWSLGRTGGYVAAGTVCLAAMAALLVASFWAESPALEAA